MKIKKIFKGKKKPESAKVPEKELPYPKNHEEADEAPMNSQKQDETPHMMLVYAAPMPYNRSENKVSPDAVSWTDKA